MTCSRWFIFNNLCTVVCNTARFQFKIWKLLPARLSTDVSRASFRYQLEKIAACLVTVFKSQDLFYLGASLFLSTYILLKIGPNSNRYWNWKSNSCWQWPISMIECWTSESIVWCQSLALFLLVYFYIVSCPASSVVGWHLYWIN